jgi:hypothetical protein
VLGVAFIALTLCLSSLSGAQQSDLVVAERVLGVQWKQISRRAGMIFAGTVLRTARQIAPNPAVVTQAVASQSADPGMLPAVQLSFRVDTAIAGVEQGQILTIREWAGALSMHRPMRSGQHILIFLYPTSRLGLTSLVGGSLGQVALDANGNVARHEKVAADKEIVSVLQLERAIRSAREE